MNGDIPVAELTREMCVIQPMVDEWTRSWDDWEKRSADSKSRFTHAFWTAKRPLLTCEINCGPLTSRLAVSIADGSLGRGTKCTVLEYLSTIVSIVVLPSMWDQGQWGPVSGQDRRRGHNGTLCHRHRWSRQRQNP